jgi:hypothetical protein
MDILISAEKNISLVGGLLLSWKGNPSFEPTPLEKAEKRVQYTSVDSP